MEKIYFSTNWCHLGDIIAVLQWTHAWQLAHPNMDVFVGGDKQCQCGCEARQDEQMQQVLSLMDTKVQFIDNIPPRTPYGKVPFYKGDNIVYCKAKNLPKQQDHITVQLTPRSATQHDGRKLNSKNIKNILECIERHQIINLGDTRINNIEPIKGNIVEKFNWIASAKMHISVDSGTAHLASLSNTPTVILCPDKYFNRYKPQTNTYCFSNIDSMLDFLANFCLGKSLRKRKLL